MYKPAILLHEPSATSLLASTISGERGTLLSPDSNVHYLYSGKGNERNAKITSHISTCNLHICSSNAASLLFFPVRNPHSRPSKQYSPIRTRAAVLGLGTQQIRISHPKLPPKTHWKSGQHAPHVGLLRVVKQRPFFCW